MKYYRVKPQYDNCKLSKSFEILVGTELFTVKEWGCKTWYTQGKSTAAQTAI